MKLKIPITVELVSPMSTQEVSSWLGMQNAFGRVSYEWSKGVLSFEDEDDALAFCLKFGARRHETTVERMLKNEEGHDRR